MSDADAEKVSLEPDSVAFMETLIARGRGQVGLQNGFSPTNLDEDALSGGGSNVKTRDDWEKSSTPQEQNCPVGLHKAVLLYPTSTLTHSVFPEALLANCAMTICISIINSTALGRASDGPSLQ